MKNPEEFKAFAFIIIVGVLMGAGMLAYLDGFFHKIKKDNLFYTVLGMSIGAIIMFFVTVAAKPKMEFVGEYQMDMKDGRNVSYQVWILVETSTNYIERLK